MTCSIPDHLEQELAARATARRTTTDELVVEALTWYLQSAGATSPPAGIAENALDIFRQLQQSAGITPHAAASWKAAIHQARR